MICLECDESFSGPSETGLCPDCQDGYDLEELIYEEELHESEKVSDYEDE